ncbi:MAG: outer membrane protein assembly factor BamE [Gemmataceae bacterium]|nr:outer membrane protein assembly factor BamE [Gemmataceae bacterium]
MKRDVYLLGIGIALVACAFVLTDHLLRPRPAITQASWERIRPGMSLRQVEDILGAPPGNYTRQCVLLDLYGGGLFMKLDGLGRGTFKEWVGDQGAVQILVDPTGRVVWGRFVPGCGAGSGMRYTGSASASP